MHVTPSSFSSAAGITNLEASGLAGPGTALLQQAQHAGSASSFELWDSRGVSEMLGVKRTLRRLILTHDRARQVDQAGFDILLALPVLKSLDLRNRERRPVTVSIFGLQLTEFPSGRQRAPGFSSVS